MRIDFYRRLAALTTAISEMCALAGESALRATESLLEADVALAEIVIDDSETILFEAARVEQDAVSLLTLQAPVAGDLRTVVASLKDVADVKRVGTLALHVSETVRRRHPERAVPVQVEGCFAEMGRIAAALGDYAKGVVLCGDAGMAAHMRAGGRMPWMSYTASCCSC